MDVGWLWWLHAARLVGSMPAEISSVVPLLHQCESAVGLGRWGSGCALPLGWGFGWAWGLGSQLMCCQGLCMGSCALAFGALVDGALYKWWEVCYHLLQVFSGLV